MKFGLLLDALTDFWKCKARWVRLLQCVGLLLLHDSKWGFWLYQSQAWFTLSVFGSFLAKWSRWFFLMNEALLVCSVMFWQKMSFDEVTSKARLGLVHGESCKWEGFFFCWSAAICFSNDRKKWCFNLLSYVVLWLVNRIGFLTGKWWERLLCAVPSMASWMLFLDAAGFGAFEFDRFLQEFPKPSIEWSLQCVVFFLGCGCCCYVLNWQKMVLDPCHKQGQVRLLLDWELEMQVRGVSLWSAAALVYFFDRKNQVKFAVLFCAVW